jgi:salicylate hydroxylase
VLGSTLPGTRPTRPTFFVHRARLVEVLEQRRAGGGRRDPHRRRGSSRRARGADARRGRAAFRLRTRSTARRPFFTGQVAWRALVSDPDAAPEVQVFMGPGRHLVTYPLAWGLRNIVAVEERADWAAEGWHHEDDPDNLRRAFAVSRRRWPLA